MPVGPTLVEVEMVFVANVVSKWPQRVLTYQTKKCEAEETVHLEIDTGDIVLLLNEYKDEESYKVYHFFSGETTTISYYQMREHFVEID